MTRIEMRVSDWWFGCLRLRTAIGPTQFVLSKKNLFCYLSIKKSVEKKNVQNGRRGTPGRRL